MGFEQWWDQESEKHKEPSKITNVEVKKDAPPPAPPVAPSMTSALAGLFQPRHPWGQEGGLESGLGFTRFNSGGLLGIRGGISKLPSFKKKEAKAAAEVKENIDRTVDKKKDSS